jgi:glycosyltransferase involved in cell wall biosynthesis
MAASNRVRNLAKGIALEGFHVEYVGLRGADILKEPCRSYPPHGKEEDILYHYPGSISVRPINWWARRVDDFLSFFCALFFFIGKKLCGKADAVLLYTRNKNIGGFWIPFLHFLKIPVILEVCEWPLAIANVKPQIRHQAEKFCHSIVPKADGILPISGYIENEIIKVCHNANKRVPSFKIPILIDVDKDEKVHKKKNTHLSSFVLYSGSIAYMDIAWIVVDIIYELKRAGRPVKLLFTGGGDQKSFLQLKEYAREKVVLDLLEFKGFLPESELHRLMREAACLLAPLPDNPQSESRFSTKIGYYLASATPVVTNGIGDVKIYLKDGVNASMADTCNPKEFADRIISLLDREDSAVNIGAAGRQLALEKFHYTQGCKGLGEFIHKVIHGDNK